MGDEEAELGRLRQAVEQIEAAEDRRPRPTSQASGVRNRRGASGSRRRMTSMQTATAMKAVSVPALASAARSASGTMPGEHARRSTAVNMVIRTGEPRPDTRARPRGSRPSRAMTKKIRLWP